jgi:hypothetical protein
LVFELFGEFIFNFAGNSVTINFLVKTKYFNAEIFRMRQLNSLKLLVLLLSIFLFVFSSNAQNEGVPPVDIKVVSEEDTVPSIIKALPEWEKMQEKATRVKNLNELKKALGEQKVFDLIDFTGGTEGITADYPAGKLLIIEFQTPQGSVDTDSQVQKSLAENPVSGLYYRRVGNYSVFLLDGKDEASANALLNQVKYDKVVQWLGKDPNYLHKAEQYFVHQASQLFVSTVVVFVGGIVLALLLGIITGIVYFRWRKQRVNETAAFSDAGGMIRLNLDELTEAINE